MKWLNRAVAFVWIGFFTVSAARADWEVLPESHDQQFRTFGLFIDNQTSLLFLPHENNVWLGLGEEVALLGNDQAYGHPQLVVYASVNAGDRMNPAGNTILMETIDVRAGLSYEMSLDEKQRVSVSWMHQSGHTSDDVQDADLIHPNLGNEQLLIRYLRDIDERFRMGGTLKPYIGTDPGMVRWGSDQFGEWYPWGTASSLEKFTPFVAAGVEEYGPDRVYATFHAQAGAYIGNHLRPLWKPNLRVVGGYYNGVDPRLKYAQFKDGLQRFYYFGAELGL